MSKFEAAEIFKIGSVVYDNVSKQYGIVTGIEIERCLDDDNDDYDYLIMLKIKLDNNEEIFTNLHCEITLAEKFEIIAN